MLSSKNTEITYPQSDDPMEYAPNPEMPTFEELLNAVPVCPDIDDPAVVRSLIRMFDDQVEDPDGADMPIVLRTDIDLAPRDWQYPPMGPSDFHIVKFNEQMKPSLDKLELVKYLKAQHIVYQGRQAYIFNSRTYVPLTDTEVMRIAFDAVIKLGGPYLSASTQRDILSGIQTLSTFADIDIPESFNEDGRYDGAMIPFANGMYSLHRDAMEGYTPYWPMLWSLGAWYNPKLREHPVEEIYRKIIPDDDTRRFFFEMVGYIAYSRTLAPPAIFVIYGPGNTGKTALQEAITALVGPANVSHLDLAQISGKFTTAELENKLLNVCGETGSGMRGDLTKSDGELLKNLASGGRIMVEKKTRQPYEMTNTAKMLFVSNRLPNFGDTSSGIQRRIHIIPCRQEQSWAEQIYAKLTDENAVSWLANKALEAYLAFIRRGEKFLDSAEMREMASNFRTQEPIDDFLEAEVGQDRDMIRANLDGRRVRDVYKQYQAYVSDTGGKPLSMRKFSEIVRNEYSMKTAKVNGRSELGTASSYMEFRA